MNNKVYMSFDQTAKHLGISRRMLEEWSSTGKIRSHWDPFTGKRIYEKEYLKKNFNNISLFSNIEGNE